MSKIKSAPEKKRASYQRDHYTAADEYPKAFRTSWPRKKERANRSVRHRVTQALATGLLERAKGREDIVVEHIRREPVKKHGTERLKERIERTQERRLESHDAKGKRAKKKLEAISLVEELR